ncbi:trans-aconitate 2-methyltransferase [Glycomyces sp. YM15]|uniref:class I SAM-dependent methyltransferase n=1 Tax=Glycomyces sp. YM15 TaxID=2800446 RepID=UPI001964F7E0|nr:class I SAM-dependent methyltransferase [Glycomyces sp. YM15]
MTVPQTDPREAFAERLIEDVTRSLETLSVYLGVKLDLYRALADHGPANAADLAASASIAPRYAREWLEQQTTARYLECEDLTAPAEGRRYRLPETRAEVLLDGDSPFHAAPGVTMFGGVAGVLDQLVDAYRSGGGVPYSAYGEDIRNGIAAFNRPQYLHELPAWLEAVPEIDSRLRGNPEAHILDLGCGAGQSTLAMARVYPHAHVTGVDLDHDSIAEARAAAIDANLGGRVDFTDADVAGLSFEAEFDLVTMFETLHDMADPVGALRTARSLLAVGGSVLIGDERVADDLTDDGDLIERFQFGWSVVHCLPATMAEDPVEANGTMLRTPTLARWAQEAGFTYFQVAPIENDFWRFYLLRE